MNAQTETAPNRGWTADDELAYRPISVMAVISILFGAASVLAFVSKEFWVLPVLGFVISIVTSRTLERAKREYAGQFLAKAGILLSLLFGVGAITKDFTRKLILANQAREFTNRYLDLLLENRVKESFVLAVEPYFRHGRESMTDQLIQQYSPKYRAHLANEIVQLLKGKGEVAQIVYHGTTLSIREQGFDLVGMLYVAKIDDRDYEVRILAKSAISPTGDWEGRMWWVDGGRVKPLENK